MRGRTSFAATRPGFPARSTKALVGVLLPLALAAPAAAQSVQGQLLQQGTDQAIAGATVQLVTADSARVVASVTTDAQGGFLLRAPAPGGYRLHAERIGFKPTDSQPFALAKGKEPLQVKLYLGVRAVPLEPLVIVAQRSDPHLKPYYDHEKEYGAAGLGNGYFIGGAKLAQELKHATRPSDIVRIVPHVIVRGTGGRSRQVRMQTTYDMSSIQGCVPDVFVDGERIPAGSGSDIDQLVSVSEISAIEVYPGIYKPPEYDTGRLCGAIVIWTGLPPAEASTGEHGLGLKTLAVAIAGFALVVGVIALAWQ